MKRKSFIKSMAVLPLTGISLHCRELDKATTGLSNTDQMPVLFLGHGSPMNAIEENSFVAGFRKVGKEIQTPAAIICISAHWETNGTFVTAMEQPRTIHDFGGFPKALYQVQYPAPGHPKLADETQKTISKTEVGLDHAWGLDHGSWSVVKHMYPDANIPIIQLSLDRRKPAQYHYELAKELSALRQKGVLIIGSGNMVHNLRRAAWDKMNETDYAYDWAREANEKMKNLILDHNHDPLINYSAQGKAFELAIPTPEHYLPLIYVLALQKKNEDIQLFNDQAVGGSLTMTSVKIS